MATLLYVFVFLAGVGLGFSVTASLLIPFLPKPDKP